MYQTPNPSLVNTGRQRRSATVRRLGALASAVALTATACGGSDADPGAQPTALPEEVTTTATEVPVDTEVPASDPPEVTTTAPEPEPAVTEAPTTVPPVTEPAPAETTPPAPAQAGALSVAEILAISADILGPTEDAFADLSAIGPVNAAIPSPMDADVFQLDYEVSRFNPSNDPQVSAAIGFSSASSAQDLATFYETELSAAGFEQTGSGETTSGSTAVLTSEYDIPGSDLGFTNIDVAVFDREDERLVEVRLVDKDPSGDVGRLGTWVTEIPGLETLEVIKSDVRVTTIFTINLDLNVFGTLPGADDPITSRDAFVAGLAGGTWTLDEAETADADADEAYVRDAAGNVAKVSFNDDGNVTVRLATELEL